MNVHDVYKIEQTVVCIDFNFLFMYHAVGCPPGMYHDINNNTCENCPPGTYNDVDIQTECQPCQDGYTSDLGSIWNTSCKCNYRPVAGFR